MMDYIVFKPFVNADGKTVRGKRAYWDGIGWTSEEHRAALLSKETADRIKKNGHKRGIKKITVVSRNPIGKRRGDRVITAKRGERIEGKYYVSVGSRGKAHFEGVPRTVAGIKKTLKKRGLKVTAKRNPRSPVYFIRGTLARKSLSFPMGIAYFNSDMGTRGGFDNVRANATKYKAKTAAEHDMRRIARSLPFGIESIALVKV